MYGRSVVELFIRAALQALKKATELHRGEISVLKKRLTSVETMLKKLNKGSSKPVVVHTANADDKKAISLRFRVSGFTSLCKKLVISVAQMGRMLSVSDQPVYYREAGRAGILLP